MPGRPKVYELHTVTQERLQWRVHEQDRPPSQEPKSATRDVAKSSHVASHQSPTPPVVVCSAGPGSMERTAAPNVRVGVRIYTLLAAGAAPGMCLASATWAGQIWAG